MEGVFLTRDLVSEPGNILHPDEYAKRIVKLRKFGLKVTVYDQKRLKKLGFNALLGVGQGSIRGSYMVTIEWNGNKNKSKPLAFVGKGVCFDTGGISLKPAKFMEDMTYDMAGSATVVGLMKTLALRKSKINAVGVVGLVENMPGANAQRPGDIVKSYSGQTIEVLNTDAEGRLVLADALTYTEEKFKPSLIIDLATLTGAIIVALGSEYAGLWSNNKKLSKQLFDAGEHVEEKVWEMPLHENYNKLMNSNNADMQNAATDQTTCQHAGHTAEPRTQQPAAAGITCPCAEQHRQRASDRCLRRRSGRLAPFGHWRSRPLADWPAAHHQTRAQTCSQRLQQ
mgnify:CR=1 FL=1